MAKKKRMLKYDDFYQDDGKLKIDKAREFLLTEIPDLIGKLYRRGKALDGLRALLKDDDTVCQICWNGLVTGSIGSYISYAIKAMQLLQDSAEMAKGKDFSEARTLRARANIAEAKKNLEKFGAALDEMDKNIAAGDDVEKAEQEAFLNLANQFEADEEAADKELDDLDPDIKKFFDEMEGSSEDE